MSLNGNDKGTNQHVHEIKCRNHFHFKKITYKKEFDRLMSLPDTEVSCLLHNVWLRNTKLCKTCIILQGWNDTVESSKGCHTHLDHISFKSKCTLSFF